MLETLSRNSMLFAAQRVDTFVETAPLFELNQWWHLLILLAAVLACLALTVGMAIRDWSDQRMGVIAAGIVLRVSILAIIFCFFLNFEKRRAQVTVKSSRLSVILDTSLSMNLAADDSSDSSTRLSSAIESILDQELWDELTRIHEVRFFKLSNLDSESVVEEVAVLPCRANTENERGPVDASGKVESGLSGYQIGWAAGSIALMLLIAGVVIRRGTSFGGWLLFAGASLGVAAGAILLVSDVRNEREIPWRVWESRVANESSDFEKSSGKLAIDDEFEISFSKLQTNLKKLIPNVQATQLSDAIIRAIREKNGQALSSVIVLTDGESNSGSSISVASNLAKANDVRIFPIGLGTNRKVENLSIVDVQAPRRVYLGDPLSVSGSVRVESVTSVRQVELVLNSSTKSRPNIKKEMAREILEIDTIQALQPFSFPLEEQPQGEWLFDVSVTPLDAEINLDDNHATVNVEVIDKTSKVLLFAGGPNREFRFLRNQLFRDPKINVDVLLQTADDGADQEGDKLLTDFPSVPNEMFEYDCVIAFDPDWSQLSSDQTELLRTWVADEAGGMVAVAGPVNTPIWTSRPNDDEIIDPIRKLYPVQFYSQATGSIKLGRFGGTESFPLNFTNVAASLEFLRFAETSKLNDELWNQIKVFGFYAVNEEKPGAEVIAYFSDPATRFSGKSPIYLASQLYGSGRIFFQASGEMWRTRGVGPEFFESYYTRLIRWSSQGRLLRDSGSIVLSVNKENCWPGETVEIRAVVKKDDGAFSALDSLPITVTLEGTAELVELKRLEDGTNNSIFAGSFPVRSVGRHVVEFSQMKTVVETDETKEMTRVNFVSRIPNLELLDPRRNDEALTLLAESSGGKYFVGDDWNAKRKKLFEELRLVPDNRIETVASLGIDQLFQKRLLVGYFALLTIFYSLSWIVRRTHRLA